MDLSTIINTVIAALVVQVVYLFFKSRSLYVVLPKLYMQTPISAGRIVSISIRNEGLLSEEDIAVVIHPQCKIELLGSAKSSVTLRDNTLVINKLSRLEKVEILLLVEGNTLDSTSIESVESKHAKGKVVEKETQVSAPWQGAIAIPVILLTLFLPFSFGYFIGKEVGIPLTDIVGSQLGLNGPTLQLAGYKNAISRNFIIGSYRGRSLEKLIDVKVVKAVRNQDIVTMTVSIENKTEKAFIVSAWYEGSSGDGPYSRLDNHIGSFALEPKKSAEITTKIYLPEEAAIKIVKGTYSLENIDGDQISFDQMVNF